MGYVKSTYCETLQIKAVCKEVRCHLLWNLHCPPAPSPPGLPAPSPVGEWGLGREREGAQRGWDMVGTSRPRQGSVMPRA